MSKHLVLVGGGHAHMTVLINLHKYVARGHGVTLIGPSPYHYYSGMGPGLLSGIYRPQEVRFHVKKMVEDRGASFIQDTVTHIDPDQKVLILKSGNKVQYDVVSFNTGSYVPTNSDAVRGGNIFTVKPIENLINVRKMLKAGLSTKTPRLLIVGGGAAALELTGNLWRLVHSLGTTASITVLGGRSFFVFHAAKSAALCPKITGDQKHRYR